jgi:hypothetical protein
MSATSPQQNKAVPAGPKPKGAQQLLAEIPAQSRAGVEPKPKLYTETAYVEADAINTI